MTFVEFARAFLDGASVGVIITDADLALPGPKILYANAELGRMTGRNPDEIVGMSPRFMQGKETRRASLDVFRRALVTRQRFHGFLTNYRLDGTKYRAEIDCRPCRANDGAVFAFIAFQREVTRRVGRPASGQAGRYAASGISNDLLAAPLRLMRVFESDHDKERYEE